MRTTATTVLALVLAASAGFGWSAFGAGRVATPTSPVMVGDFELRNADRGAVKRVKVFHSGRLVATIVLRRGEATGYCCTQDSCKKVETSSACSTFAVACGENGSCSAG